jgi:hypothetical protein
MNTKPNPILRTLAIAWIALMIYVFGNAFWKTATGPKSQYRRPDPMAHALDQAAYERLQEAKENYEFLRDRYYNHSSN